MYLLADEQTEHRLHLMFDMTVDGAKFEKAAEAVRALVKTHKGKGITSSGTEFTRSLSFDWDMAALQQLKDAVQGTGLTLTDLGNGRCIYQKSATKILCSYQAA